MLDFFSSRKAIAVRRLRLVSRKLTATLTRGKILWLFHPPGKASFLRKFSLLQGLPEKMCIQVLNLSFLHSLDALHNKHLREGGANLFTANSFMIQLGRLGMFTSVHRKHIIAPFQRWSGNIMRMKWKKLLLVRLFMMKGSQLWNFQSSSQLIQTNDQ